MCVGTTTASARFRVAMTLPSSAMHADRQAETASANKKLVTPERTKSNIPAAFLTFLFARLHVDAKLKAKGTQYRNIHSFRHRAKSGAKVLVRGKVVSCPQGATIASDS